MAVLDADISTDLTAVDVDGGTRFSPASRPEHEPCDLLTLERERARADREQARADAAEARCEELRLAEIDARARAGSLKWHFDRSRSKLKATVEEAKELRRTTKYIPTLQGELGLLEQVLSEAGTESSEHNAVGSARMVIRRLRGILTQV